MSKDIRARLQSEQLHHAAARGNLDEVNVCLTRKYPVNRFDDIGKTPLHYAVEGGHIEIVDRLIACGANVNAHDERHIGNTPLSDNVRHCSYAMAKRLIQAGANPSIPGWMGLTALDRANERTDIEASKIRVLLKEAAKRREKAAK
jgi:ankyrin repeat protein